MLKARNKKISMLLILAMMMTMFIGVGTASAAATYSAETCPTFSDTTANNQNLGIIAVNVSNAAGISVYDTLTVSLPDGVTLADSTIATSTSTFTRDNAKSVQIYNPGFFPGTTDTNSLAGASITGVVGGTKKSIDISFPGTTTIGAGVFYIYTNKANLDGVDDDMTATLSSSNSSVFPFGTVTIGKYSSGGGTYASVKSVKSVGTGGGEIDSITLIETVAGTWKAGDKIKVKLPAGFEWYTGSDAKPVVQGKWRYVNTVGVLNNTLAYASLGLGNGTSPYYTVAVDGRTLSIVINAALITATANSAATTARIDIGAIDSGVTDPSTAGRLAQITVTDDSVAKLGDVTAAISGDDTTDADLVIANMADYGATVTAVTSDSIVAGWDKQLDTAKFQIVEGTAGSLVKGRDVTLTLPDGAKWLTNYVAQATVNAAPATFWPEVGDSNPKPVTVSEYKGTATPFTNADDPAVSNNGKTLKFKLDSTSTSARTIDFKKFQVAVRADFTGELDVTVAGNAGAAGTAKIADVVAPLSITSDGAAKIVVGAQNQAVGDITLKEAQAAAIDTEDGSYVYLALPDGATWSATPTVTVTDGDVTIDSIDTNDSILKIEFKDESTTASTITISNVKITTTRVIPEGDMKIKVTSDSDALTDNSDADRFNISNITSAVIGQCVTPSGANTTTVEFRIGSNIYTVNGVSKVMDVAPYIKNGRTYVPMRYAAETIGAEVVWDATAQTVTLTKGDTVAVFTIGSTTYTINGEAKTCDVAPELTSDRTMLPARYVAEAFGASVGWDAASQTVLIQ